MSLKEHEYYYTPDVLKDVRKERRRQNKAIVKGKIPVDCASAYYGDDEKLAVLAEEFGEVARAINEGDYSNLYDELIQTAAVAVAFAEGLREEGYVD